MSEAKDCVAEMITALGRLQDIANDTEVDTPASKELLKQIVALQLALEKLSRAVEAFDDDELDHEEEEEEDEEEEESE